MMAHETGPDPLDAITAGLRREDAKLRRRTLWLSLVPVAVGGAVLWGAWQGVERAQALKVRLAQQQLALEREIASQQEFIVELQTARLALDREIAARQGLLDEAARTLPQPRQQEIQALQQGLEQAREGQTDAALKSYEQAIVSNTVSSFAHRLRGRALYDEGRYEEAAASLRRAIEIAPDDAEAHYTLALVLWASGHEQPAYDQIALAFRDPTVKARAMQDPHYKPIRIFQDMRAGKDSGTSTDEKRWIDQGLAAARKGDFERALRAYTQALELNPDNWRVWNWRGYALLRMGRPDEAAASLERAIKLAPTEPEPRYNLSLAHWAAGRGDAARASIEGAYEVDPAYREIAARDVQSKALRASIKR